MGDINWPGFSQNFGAWLLPWITLMFQIPFGAERKSPQYFASVFCLTRGCSGTQSRWMMYSPSSSPWVHLLSQPTPSRSHTSTIVGSPQHTWMPNIPIPSSYRPSYRLFITFPSRYHTILLFSTLYSSSLRTTNSGVISQPQIKLADGLSRSS